MKQRPFEQAHAASWQAFEQDLVKLEKRAKLGAPRAEQFPAHYRAICQQLALARARHYSPDLAARLNALALRGHQQLYRSGKPFLNELLEFLYGGFPRAVRRDGALFLSAALLFFGSFIAMALACYAQSELIYSLMSPEQVRQIEHMYEPARHVLGREREADSDVYMFGHYLMHNTGIGFQTFAGGLLAGLGTLFYLLHNGLMLGAVSGHLTRLGLGDTFWPFVCGHGAFELTAIVLAGQAGLKLGLAVLAPGRRTRSAALRRAAGDAVPLIGGCGLFFALAAVIEAFWSASMAVPPMMKYTVAAGLWSFVVGYLSLAGRYRGA